MDGWMDGWIHVDWYIIYLGMKSLYIADAASSCRQCFAGDYFTILATDGYISNFVAKETGCGGPDCPFVIQAKPGQRLRLTSIETDLQGPANSRVCKVRATIREMDRSRSVTVCSGDKRIRDVYISRGNRVQIRLLQTQFQSGFLLHYKGDKGFQLHIVLRHITYFFSG